jgi:hypothetical protein
MRPAEQQRMRRFRDAALEPMSARDAVDGSSTGT